MNAWTEAIVLPTLTNTGADNNKINGLTLQPQKWLGWSVT